MPRATTPAVLVTLWLATWGVALLAAARAYGAPPQETRLVMPPPKACIDGAAWAELAGDTGFFSPEGLSEEEIDASMRDFLPQLARCVPAGTSLSAQVTVHMEVACTGRVTRVSFVDQGDLPSPLTSCLQETLRYAPLPAHDAEEGFDFDYRLRLMFITPPARR